MSRFKPGDQVVCIHKGVWISTDKTTMFYGGPQFNEECIVNGIISDCHLVISGHEIYPENGLLATYKDRWFEPLITDSQLEEELKSIEKSKTIELV